MPAVLNFLHLKYKCTYLGGGFIVQWFHPCVDFIRADLFPTKAIFRAVTTGSGREMVAVTLPPTSQNAATGYWTIGPQADYYCGTCLVVSVMIKEFLSLLLSFSTRSIIIIFLRQFGCTVTEPDHERSTSKMSYLDNESYMMVIFRPLVSKYSLLVFIIHQVKSSWSL